MDDMCGNEEDQHKRVSIEIRLMKFTRNRATLFNGSSAFMLSL
jgi:hypothetical protein